MASFVSTPVNPLAPGPIPFPPPGIPPPFGFPIQGVPTVFPPNLNFPAAAAQMAGLGPIINNSDIRGLAAGSGSRGSVPRAQGRDFGDRDLRRSSFGRDSSRDQESRREGYESRSSSSRNDYRSTRDRDRDRDRDRRSPSPRRSRDHRDKDYRDHDYRSRQRSGKLKWFMKILKR